MSRGCPVFRSNAFAPLGSHRAESIKTRTRPCARTSRSRARIAAHRRADAYRCRGQRRDSPSRGTIGRLVPHSRAMRIPARSISHQGFQSGNTRIRACRSSMVTGSPAMSAWRSSVRDVRVMASSSRGDLSLFVAWRHGLSSVTASASASSAAATSWPVLRFDESTHEVPTSWSALSPPLSLHAPPSRHRPDVPTTLSVVDAIPPVLPESSVPPIPTVSSPIPA